MSNREKLNTYVVRMEREVRFTAEIEVEAETVTRRTSP